MTRILGIDPGSRLTGFGIIEKQNQKSLYITSGCIKMTTEAMPQRLFEIYQGINQIIEEYQPTVAAIEQIFMYRNAASALKLGQARGVAIVAAVQYQLTIYEYAPTQIKQAIVGKGHADKQQVQHMVKVLLCLPKTPQADAADALAVALCHTHNTNNKSLN
jgi:crossover junction endodeoxyribonuclease RuvC